MDPQGLIKNLGSPPVTSLYIEVQKLIGAQTKGMSKIPSLSLAKLAQSGRQEGVKMF